MVSRYRYKGLKGVAAGLALGLLTALVLVAAPPTLALPTAASFGVEDASGDKETYAVVPVNISTVQNGPVICIIFDIAYDTIVVNVVEVQRGDLTSTWDPPDFNNFAWGTRVAIVYDGNTTNGIQDGTTGSVVNLNFSIKGTPGSSCGMNLSNIQFSDTGYSVGTASAKNGTFSILGEPEPTPTPAPTPPPAPPRLGGGGGGGGGGGSLIFPPYLSTSTPTPAPSPTPSVTVTPLPTTTPTHSPSLASLASTAPSQTPTEKPRSGLLPLHMSDLGGIVFFITAYGFIFDSVAIWYLTLKWSYRKILRRSPAYPNSESDVKQLVR
ncbi:MAG: hypothetical protein EFT35_00115 [Methanophagales archaeon ANME-1-THS]|nr:MAG: hypothetical protein EFT35_00115 [Methanophagales archaeon ANME-1-THS]